MAYLDYPGLAYFKSLLDETYLHISYNDDGTAVITDDTIFEGDVTFDGGATFTKSVTVDSGDPQNPAYIFGDLNGKAKLDWKGQQIDSTYIKKIETNNNVGTIVYTKGDNSTGFITIDLMQGATSSVAGKAGLVPAPTISERTKFLRGDGEWSVPTDIYVTQNLINTNDSFPILIGATAGATESQIGTAIAFGTKVSVNPNTHALIADHLILKHPTYRRDNAVTSKVMYTLNFADSNDGNGNNLSEIYGYIDKPSEGGEHELGFRLFGNPNVQGVEEIFTYLSVGLSKTNVPYGHAPETPVPADHNEDTDIITRSYLKLNGSITGLVHTTMPEEIYGIKTFKDETINDSTAGITTTKLTASGKITGTGTAEISGGSGNTPSLKVTGNETVTGDLNVGGSETVTGNISTTAGNITTTNGIVSGKTGSIGTGGLTVIGPSNLNGGASITGNETVSGTLTVGGKITGNGGAAISGGNGLQVTGNETVSGNLTVSGTTTTEDLTVTDDATVGDDLTVNGDSLIKGNETVKGDETVEGDIIVKGSIFKNSKNGDEYVSYITNQQETKTTIINNLIDPDQGLKLITKGTGANQKSYIAVKLGSGLSFNTETGTKGQIDVDFKSIPASVRKAIVNGMVDAEGALIGCEKEFIPEGETYHYYDSDGELQEAVAPEGGIDNPNYGRLTVDFSQMPQDSFIELMSSMIDAQQISSSGGKNSFYVDGTNGHDTDAIIEKGHVNNLTALKNLATDNLEVGDYYTVGSSNKIYVWKGASWGVPSATSRGTPAAPFKTIQGCVNFITKVYKFNTTSAYINCQNIDEHDMLRLPSFDRTTASIVIRACTFDENTVRGGGTLVDPTNIPITANTEDAIEDYLYPLKISLKPESGKTHCINITGTGVWSLHNFNLEFDDTVWNESAGHQSPLHVTDYATCDLTTCKINFIRSKQTFWRNLLTTGQHCIFVSSYALCEINKYVKIEGHDYEADSTYINTLFNQNNTGDALPTETSNYSIGDFYRTNIYSTGADPEVIGYNYYCWTGSSFEKFASPFKRVLNGFKTSDRATVRIQDTRQLNNDDRSVHFKGSFSTLVSCGSVFIRNFAYMGKADVSAVTDTDYRFYIYAGGYVRLSGSGTLNYIPSIEKDPNNPDGWVLNYTANCNDNWLGAPNITNSDGSARTSYVERATNSWYA